MDFTAHQAELLAHYIALAKQPAWKAHAWHRVNELARECSQLYADFPRLLTEAMHEAVPPEASGAEGGRRA